MIPQSKCRWLVLVPTEFELESMRAFWPNAFDKADVVVELCGFGPIAAAARAAELISRFRPLRVLLLGIAGSYADDLEVGSVLWLHECAVTASEHESQERNQGESFHRLYPSCRWGGVDMAYHRLRTSRPTLVDVFRRLPGGAVGQASYLGRLFGAVNDHRAAWRTLSPRAVNVWTLNGPPQVGRTSILRRMVGGRDQERGGAALLRA